MVNIPIQRHLVLGHHPFLVSSTVSTVAMRVLLDLIHKDKSSCLITVFEILVQICFVKDSSANMVYLMSFYSEIQIKKRPVLSSILKLES